VKHPAALLALGGGLAVAALLASCRGPAGSATGSSAKKEVVCYECHIDFKGEELTTAHERAGVTCIRCHGASQPHMNDEVRKTPPDAIFRDPTMKVFCLTCHVADYGAVNSHRAEEAKRKTGGKPRACTECHGEHKLVRADAKP